MPLIPTKYSDAQRNAIKHAGVVVGIKPLTSISRMAKVGELAWEGQKLEPFDVPDATVRDIVRTEERRRAGAAHSDLVNKPHHDAVEMLRRRMISLLDHETLRLEDAQRAKPKVALDAEHARKLVRVLRELAALPAPGERGERPGATVPGTGKPRAGEAVAKPTSIGGKLADAIERSMTPAQAAQSDDITVDTDRAIPPQTVTENSSVADDETNESHAPAQTASATDEPSAAELGGEDPGAHVRARLASLSATHVDGQPVAR